MKQTRTVYRKEVQRGNDYKIDKREHFDYDPRKYDYEDDYYEQYLQYDGNQRDREMDSIDSYHGGDYSWDSGVYQNNVCKKHNEFECVNCFPPPREYDSNYKDPNWSSSYTKRNNIGHFENPYARQAANWIERDRNKNKYNHENVVKNCEDLGDLVRKELDNPRDTKDKNEYFDLTMKDFLMINMQSIKTSNEQVQAMQQQNSMLQAMLMTSGNFKNIPVAHNQNSDKLNIKKKFWDKGKLNQNINNKKSAVNPREIKKCEGCGKIGHLKNECRKFKNDPKTKKTGQLYNLRNKNRNGGGQD